MNYTLSGKEQEKIYFLTHLGKEILKKLNVRFSVLYLQRAIITSYSLIFESKHNADKADEIAVADPDDPSNLSIVLLEALKVYNVKNYIVDEPLFSSESALLTILAANGAGSNYKELISVGEPGEGTVPGQVQGEVENYVLIRGTSFSGEPGYDTNRKKQQVNNIMASLSLLIILSSITTAVVKGVSNFPVIVWLPELLILASGIFVSYNLFLLDKTRYRNSYLVKKFCSGNGNKDGCLGVLSSKGAKLFGAISMTDIGALYFGSLFVFLLLSLLNNSYDQDAGILFWASVVPLPYTLYSIYYQLRVVKKVCVLCMTVQVLLWIHFLYFLCIAPSIHIIPVLISIIRFAVVLLLSGSVYILFDRITKLSSLSAKLSLEIERYKNDVDYFDIALQREQAFNVRDLPGSITLGNPGLPVTLTGVLSLSCVACANMLEWLKNLSEWFENSVCINILIKADELSDTIAKDILHMTLQGEKQQALAYLDRWFTFLTQEIEKNVSPGEIVKAWLDKNGIEHHCREVGPVFTVHVRWYGEQSIPYTPLLMYNGNVLPRSYYDLETLKNMLEKKLEQEGVTEEI